LVYSFKSLNEHFKCRIIFGFVCSTVLIRFDAGNSIYNEVRHRRSSIHSCLSEEHDDEEEAEPVVEKVPEPVVAATAPVKKVVKKAAPVVEAPVEKVEEAPKKKIIKKKV
jgi:hypothetical protein